MQAIIMAAGRGNRLGDLTKDLPKPLLKIGDKPILQHVLEALPSEINEVILVVAYLGDKIKSFFGSRFGAVKIEYAEQGEMTGTAGAVWAAKPLLATGKFLVLSGDNIYFYKDIDALTNQDLAFGLKTEIAPNDSYHHIRMDENGHLKSFEKSRAGEKILMASGAYVLDQRVFNYEQALRRNGEFSLPHTVLKMAVDHPITGVMMNWLSGNTPEELLKMEKFIKLI